MSIAHTLQRQNLTPMESQEMYPPVCQLQYTQHTSARFAALIKNARPSAEAFARRLCESSEETKDLVQDASVVAWKYFPQLNDESKFGMLLFQIVKQQYIHRKRSQDRHRPFTGDLPGDEPVTSDGDGNRFGASFDLSEALVALKREEREIVLLKWAGFTLGELAQVYRCTVSCMNMRLRRAKENMRDYLRGSSTKRSFRHDVAGNIVDEVSRLTQWAESCLDTVDVQCKGVAAVEE